MHNKNFQAMAKKKVDPEVKKQTKELLELILKKTGTKYSEIVEAAEREYIHYNLDVITPSERKRFTKLVLQ